jgi:hypothetical protein
MTTFYVTPPDGGLLNVGVANGRRYVSTPGVPIPVPDFDALILCANGWKIVDEILAALLGNISGGSNINSGAPSSTLTGTLTKTALASIAIPALKANSHLAIYYAWKSNGSANNSTVTMTLGGQDFGFTDTRATANWVDATIRAQNLGVTNSQFVSNNSPGAHTSGGPVLLTVDTSVPQQLNIWGQLSNVGDSMSLEVCQVQILNP